MMGMERDVRCARADNTRNGDDELLLDEVAAAVAVHCCMVLETRAGEPRLLAILLYVGY